MHANLSHGDVLVAPSPTPLKMEELDSDEGSVDELSEENDDDSVSEDLSSDDESDSASKSDGEPNKAGDDDDEDDDDEDDDDESVSDDDEEDKESEKGSSESEDLSEDGDNEEVTPGSKRKAPKKSGPKPKKPKKAAGKKAATGFFAHTVTKCFVERAIPRSEVQGSMKMSSEAKKVMAAVLQDVFERMIDEANQVVQHNKKGTYVPTDVECVTRLFFPPSIAEGAHKHADSILSNKRQRTSKATREKPVANNN